MASVLTPMLIALMSTPAAIIASMAALAQVSDVSVSLDDNGRVVFAGTSVHGAWLRERCLSPASVEQATKQPLHGHETFDDAAWKVVDVGLEQEQGVMHVTFGDGHKSALDANKLKDELMGGHVVVQSSKLAPLPSRVLWSGTTAQTSPPCIPLQSHFPPRHSYEALSTGNISSLHTLTTQLLSLGFAIVEGVPTVEGYCEKFASLFSFLRSANFGKSYHLRAKPNHASGGNLDLAYGAQEIALHNDNPYRDPPFEIQALHAIKHCSCGEGQPIPCEHCSVVNYAVDAIAVAEQLRVSHPLEFEILAKTLVRWENAAHNGKDFISAYARYAPMIELEPTGRINAIHFSSKSGGYAPPMGVDAADAFYRARRLFARMLNDPTNKIALQLRAGDIWVFDNRRLLHARSSINPDVDGERHIEGCYMQRDGLLFHHERSRRAVAAVHA